MKSVLELRPVNVDQAALLAAAAALPFEVRPSTDRERILATLERNLPPQFEAGFIASECTYRPHNVTGLVGAVDPNLRPGTVPELLAYVVDQGLENCPKSFASFDGDCLGQDDSVLVEGDEKGLPQIRLYVPSEVAVFAGDEGAASPPDRFDHSVRIFVVRRPATV